MQTWTPLPIEDDLTLAPGRTYAGLVSLSRNVSLDKLVQIARDRQIAGLAWEEGARVPIAIPHDTTDNHRHVYVQGVYTGREPLEVPHRAPWPLTLFYLRAAWRLDGTPDASSPAAPAPTMPAPSSLPALPSSERTSSSSSSSSGPLKQLVLFFAVDLVFFGAIALARRSR